MSNERFQNAIQKIPQKVPPIWMMRQAGRYHRHYQNLRQKHSFVDLCKQPELAAETAMGPIQDFDFDVSILFSDLLFPLEALGMGLEYAPGPKLGMTLNAENFKSLKPLDEAWPQMEFQKQAVAATRERLPKDKSLIGFVGGVWTLFTYAVEGGHKGHLIQAKSDFNLFHQMARLLTDFLKHNIRYQLEGGAEAVMVLDTAAGELSSQLFASEVTPYVNELATEFPGQLGYYSKGTLPSHYQALWENRSWLGFGYDHRWELPSVLERSPGFTQGNLDQALLFNEPQVFLKRLKEFIKPFQEMSEEKRKGWVCGLGHGVLPKTPEDNVKAFVEVVRESFV